jgi:hypothetical protein
MTVPDIKDATRAPVYHFTSTLQLPWIVEAGEVRPYPKTLIGIGHITALWGTTKEAGDKTAGAVMTAKKQKLAWQENLFQLVRFTLPKEYFFTWNEVVSMSDWTPEQVAALVESDRKRFGEDGHAQWRLRHDPLRLADVVKVEAKAYGRGWKPIDLDPGCVDHTDDPDHLGYRLGPRTTLYGVRELLGTVVGLPLYDYRPAFLDSDERADIGFANRRRAAEAAGIEPPWEGWELFEKFFMGATEVKEPWEVR